MEGPGAQHVLVTGCDGGVGLGLVKRFLELPSPPRRLFAACTDPDGKALNELALGTPNLVVLPLDVTDAGSIGAAVGRVREELRGAGLGLLINTAGARRHSTLQAETAENMALLYATNTIGPLQVTQAFLPLLQEAAQAGRGQGLSCSRAAVVNVSSAMGSIGVAAAWGDAQDVSYRCSKAALNMLTKCQALQYGHSGILCVAIDPGDVEAAPGRQEGPVTMEESTQGVLRVLAGLSASSNGTFWDWRGQSLPW
ncbi:C-signal-like [Anas platyrhynchos]|uniref:C-signal-like n=1 Tax=Anas platyrhynchos TaxID=8839 RepID=UPI003AF3030F